MVGCGGIPWTNRCIHDACRAVCLGAVFLIFWTWVYGLLFYWPAELLLYILPLPGDLVDDLEDGYREMGFNVLSVLYIEPYYWIRRIPLEITYLMTDVIALARMDVEDLYTVYIKLVGLLTIVRVLFYMTLSQCGYYRD